MRISSVILGFAAVWSTAMAQSPDVRSALRWRSIGPARAGRARASSGASGHPTVLYIGFDNGGLWRSSDYGSNWEPLFDREATGSIGAIAVAPSDPNVLYVSIQSLNPWGGLLGLFKTGNAWAASPTWTASSGPRRTPK